MDKRFPEDWEINNAYEVNLSIETGAQVMLEGRAPSSGNDYVAIVDAEMDVVCLVPKSRVVNTLTGETVDQLLLRILNHAPVAAELVSLVQRHGILGDRNGSPYDVSAELWSRLRSEDDNEP